jgi:hypothetical protein
MSRNTPNTLPTFKSDDSRARYLAAYNVVLQDWPVSYQELDLPTCLGETHIIASGPPNARRSFCFPALPAALPSGASTLQS